MPDGPAESVSIGMLLAGRDRVSVKAPYNPALIAICRSMPDRTYGSPSPPLASRTLGMHCRGGVQVLVLPPQRLRRLWFVLRPDCWRSRTLSSLQWRRSRSALHSNPTLTTSRPGFGAFSQMPSRFGALQSSSCDRKTLFEGETTARADPRRKFGRRGPCPRPLPLSKGRRQVPSSTLCSPWSTESSKLSLI